MVSEEGARVKADDDEPGSRTRAGSMRSTAARALLGTASELVNRARRRAKGLAAVGESRPAAVADVLFLDSQQAAYAELHRRFLERAGRGDRGLASALEAFDAMWSIIRQLRAGAPAVLLTLSNEDDHVRDRRSRFYLESTWLLEDAIRAVFANDLGHLVVPPERVAVLVRVALEGLVVELAQARDASDVARVDQAYADMRSLFSKYLVDDATSAEASLPITFEPIALPW